MDDANEPGGALSLQPRQTGPQPTMPDPRTGFALKVLVGLALVLASSSLGWMGKAMWGAVVAEATAGTAKVEVVQRVEADVAALKTDVGVLKDDMRDHGKTLERIERKLSEQRRRNP